METFIIVKSFIGCGTSCGLFIWLLTILFLWASFGIKLGQWAYLDMVWELDPWILVVFLNVVPPWSTYPSLRDKYLMYPFEFCLLLGCSIMAILSVMELLSYFCYCSFVTYMQHLDASNENLHQKCCASIIHDSMFYLSLEHVGAC